MKISTIGIPDVPLSEVEAIGGRAITLLTQVGITTWEALGKCYQEQLQKIAGMGPAHRNKVIGVLAANGVKLAKKPKTPEEKAALLDSIPSDKYQHYDYHYICRLHGQNNRPEPDRFWRAWC